ncbi:PQQ-binding-like beta-propeller repeat protein [Amycolatopsis lurida]
MRRPFAAVLLSLALVVPAHGREATAKWHTGWPMGGHDLGNSRSNPAEHVLGPANVGGLALDWTVPTTGDVSATPAVVGGAVYFPDWGGSLHKADARTGAVI